MTPYILPDFIADTARRSYSSAVPARIESPHDWSWPSLRAHLDRRDDGLATVAPLLGRLGSVTALIAIEPEAVAELPEPMAAPTEPPVQPALQPVAETAPEPAPEVSLGSSIIASGLVRKPVAANDPLAPIRRMSQAEKIAFFS